MLIVKNEKVTLLCGENGRGLSILDNLRGSKWNLDEESLVYGTEKYNDMFTGKNDFKKLKALSAEVKGKESLVITYLAGEHKAQIIYTLKEDYIDIRIPITEESDLLGCISMPGAFAPAGEKLMLLLPIMQGMQWDGKGPAFEEVRGEAMHHGFTMPIIGHIAETGGLLFTAETKDDLWWWFGKNDAGRFWAANIQISSVGSMRYERVGRLYLTDKDITSIAKTYRKKVIEEGNFKNWEEKIVENPSLERLFGSLMCYIGYCQDDIDYVENFKKLKEYGFDKVFAYPTRFNIYYKDIMMGGQPAIDLSTKEIEDIKALGYDIAPWSWINEALDDGKTSTHGLYLKNPHGERVKNWEIDSQVWYLVCASMYEEYQKGALVDRIPEMTWDHFDVLACASLKECYAKDHKAHMGRPLTRSEARESIRKTFVADKQRGVAVSSENFNDAYAKDYDFGSVKAWPQYGPWPFWPVPLTMLVYHDSVVHSWWELHNYNVPWRSMNNGTAGKFEYGGGKPRLMAAMDALYGCPPDVFPFGAQYGYTGRGNETYLFKYRFEDIDVQQALREALPVSKLHEKIGKLEMVDFRFLSEDGNVQQTTFADGTKVIANFGRETYGDMEGLCHAVAEGIDSILPESWKIVK